MYSPQLSFGVSAVFSDVLDEIIQIEMLPASQVREEICQDIRSDVSF